MKTFRWLLLGITLATTRPRLEAQDPLDSVRRELAELRQRVERLERQNQQLRQRLEVDRLVVRQELVVSDTGQPWEAGFEAEQIPRGLYARPLGEVTAGLWVRSRLIKGEIDDPFDDRFHALEKDHSPRRAPGHISWNIWVGGAWRQMAIVQGEGLEPSEAPSETLDGANHPGRLRLQTFRPHHEEPLTDVLIGQGRMSVGGGGYGGGGLPYPGEVLELWGGTSRAHALTTPAPPRVLSEPGVPHTYALVAVGPQGTRSAPSPAVRSSGAAVLRWDSVPGADAYLILRDGRDYGAAVRIEGATKTWRDPEAPPTTKP